MCTYIFVNLFLTHFGNIKIYPLISQLLTKKRHFGKWIFIFSILSLSSIYFLLLEVGWAGSHYVFLTMCIRLASNSQKSTHICFPSTGIQGIHHHIRLWHMFANATSRRHLRLIDRSTHLSFFIHIYMQLDLKFKKVAAEELVWWDEWKNNHIHVHICMCVHTEWTRKWVRARESFRGKQTQNVWQTWIIM